MKKLILLLVCFFVLGGLSFATDYTDTDILYGNTSAGTQAAQFYQTWADHKTQLGLLYQAINANLTEYATTNPSVNGLSLISAADYASMVTLLGITDTDDQTAAEVSVVTTAFGTNFANDASHDTVQELMDIIDGFALGGGAPEGTAVLSTGEVGGTKFLREDGDGTSSWQIISGGGDALVANPLSQFAATTSAQLAGVVSDETGTGAVVLSSSPTLITPALGTPSAIDISNASGTLSVDIALDTAASTTSGQITYNSAKLQVGNGSTTDYFSSDTLNAASYEGELTNSAGLLAALSDETGSGVSVFGTAPSISAPVITGAGSVKITGEVQATVNVLTKGAAYTLGTDESTEVGGSLVIATAAMVLTLPTAAAGYSGCLMAGQGVAGIIGLTPAAGDYLVVDGVRKAAATQYNSAGLAGDKICYIAANIDDWYITSEVGTWSE